MRLRRVIFVASLVLAVAVLFPTAAQGAAKGTDRPLRGTETATAQVNVCLATATVDGTFKYAHLGNGTFHAVTTVTGGNISGTNTYVAANGDEIFTTIVGTGGGTEVTIVDTIIGGTGRFADASGTFTATGPVVNVFTPPCTLTGTGTNSVTGQISY
jgi:hypothetical protein